MRSERQRLAVRLPGGAKFDAQPLRINGRPVSLETGDAAEQLLRAAESGPRRKAQRRADRLVP